MAAILDLGQIEDLPWVDSGGLFFLFLHTSNEFISGEKPLLTFLSNLSRSLLRLYGFDKLDTQRNNELQLRVYYHKRNWGFPIYCF